MVIQLFGDLIVSLVITVAGGFFIFSIGNAISKTVHH